MSDSEQMRRALELARFGVGATSPNPPVGAVIVKEGREIGSGWHRFAGGPHAEIEAINDARARYGPDAVNGATVYVTLEPCSTRGRTGACTAALAKAGLRRVVIGALDPNPAHRGRAAGILSSHGIEVVEGIEEAGCEELIRPFAKVQKTGLPWMIVKTAMSLDGKITRAPEEGQWLSCPESRLDVQRLRAESDAIMTSGRTIRSDNARLTVRSLDVVAERKQPWRVILTSREDGVPEGAAVRSDAYVDRTLIYTRQRIECVLRDLVSEHGVLTVLVEAGGQLVGRLVDEGWPDEFVIYLAPMLTGGAVSAVGGEGAGSLGDRIRLANLSFRRISNDVRVRGLVAGSGGPLER